MGASVDVLGYTRRDFTDNSQFRAFTRRCQGAPNHLAMVP